MSDPYYPYLVSGLHFDGAEGSSAFYDVTGKTWGGWNGGTSGGPVIENANGAFNGAVLFGGQKHLRTTVHSSGHEFPSGTDFTVGAWVFLASGSGQGGAVLSNYHSTTGGYTFGTRYDSGSGKNYAQMRMFISGGSWPSYFDTPTTGVQIPTGQWVYLEWSRQGSNYYSFVDGAADKFWAMTPGTFVPNTSMPTYIGNTNENAGSAGTSFVGYIDDVTMFSGVCIHTTTFTRPAGPFYTVYNAFPADAGIYGLLGKDAGGLHKFSSSADPGAYFLLGNDGNTPTLHSPVTAPGDFVLSGAYIALVYTGGSPYHPAAPGAFALSAPVPDTGLIYDQRTSDPGGFESTWVLPAPRLSRNVSAAPGGFTLLGRSTDRAVTPRMSANAGGYSLLGVDAGSAITREYATAFDTGSYVLSGASAGSKTARKLTADSGTFTLNGRGAVLGRAMPPDADLFAVQATTKHTVIKTIGPT